MWFCTLCLTHMSLEVSIFPDTHWLGTFPRLENHKASKSGQSACGAIHSFTIRTKATNFNLHVIAQKCIEAAFIDEDTAAMGGTVWKQMILYKIPHILDQQEVSKTTILHSFISPCNHFISGDTSNDSTTNDSLPLCKGFHAQCSGIYAQVILYWVFNFPMHGDILSPGSSTENIVHWNEAEYSVDSVIPSTSSYTLLSSKSGLIAISSPPSFLWGD